MKIFGCGDLFIAKRLSRNGYEGFDDLQQLIMSHDACFGNLETTVHDNEGYPSRFPGGGYAMASPGCLKDIKKYGFNILSLANNHALDYSQKGLEATINHLKVEELLFTGAGMNLAEAMQPQYVECPDGRVAFIGVTSSFHDSDAAGYAGGIVPGRPGINPLRRTEYYQVTQEYYRILRQIAESTGMNDGHSWSMKNGYREETEEVFLRELHFRQADSNGRITHPLEEDMERITKSIEEARIQADCVVVSVHSHQMNGSDDKPAIFIKEFCHNCIDAGAHIIFGHGSHELRGLEIYKGKPIFYGLGDFILHNEMQYAMPRDFYDKVGVDPSFYEFTGIAMDARSKNRTRGLQANPKAWESICASIEFSDGQIRTVKLFPVTLGYQSARSVRGWPVLDESGKIMDYFKTLSKEYGTAINADNGGWIVDLTGEGSKIGTK